jgi:hypothetical protein
LGGRGDKVFYFMALCGEIIVPGCGGGLSMWYGDTAEILFGAQPKTFGGLLCLI